MKENYTSITSQEQYNEVRTQIEELIHEATTKGMLDPEVDNEYIREIGKLAKLAAEYEDTSMNILPLKSKTTPNKVIDDYVTSQLMDIAYSVKIYFSTTHLLHWYLLYKKQNVKTNANRYNNEIR